MSTVKIHHSESRQALRIEIDSLSASAPGWAVANLLARRHFGRRGYAVTCYATSWTGPTTHFHAFIGTADSRGDSATGCEIHFSVYSVESV